LETSHPISAGILLGLSLVKPQVAGMIALAVLCRRHFLAATVAGVVLASGCGVMWIATGVDPLTGMRHLREESRAFAYLSHNPLTSFLNPIFGFDRTVSVLGLTFAFLAAVLAGLSSGRFRLSTVFALCAIMSMFWSYRKGYDCGLLVIPMTLLFETAARRGGFAMWCIAFAFGLSLWIPFTHEQCFWTSIQIAHAIVWVVGGAVLLQSELRSCAKSVQSTTESNERNRTSAPC